MPEPPRIKSGELAADEILDAFRRGHRVVVQAELPGGVREVMLYHDGTVSYCDTSTTPHKHEDEDGMRACMLKTGYAKEQRWCGSRPWRPLTRL